MVSNNEIGDDTCTTPIKISQDCNIYVTELDSSKSLVFPMKASRQAYILCLEGQVNIKIEGNDGSQEDIIYDQHDAAEVFITDGSNLITSTSNSSSAHVLMVEMAFVGRGRSDI